MKKTVIACMSGVMLLMMSVVLMSAAPKDDEVMTKQDGMYVVNTTMLGKDVIGYVSPIPLKIYIKKNKVVKIEFLKNQETPKYFARVKKAMLNKWDGLKVADAEKLQVDGVTGATFSSDAVKKNVELGLQYYKKHK